MDKILEYKIHKVTQKGRRFREILFLYWLNLRIQRGRAENRYTNIRKLGAACKAGIITLKWPPIQK